jgi:hypothetical protein
MFEWLAEFDKILVTGPQRSGTRICTKMIAYDTGHEYIDEDDIGLDSLYRLAPLLHNRQCLAVQCPALCRHVHIFSADDTAIVLMRRNIEDIIASQERIGWAYEWLELARYDRSDGVIAEIKYQFWEESQRGQIQHAFEIEYESLAEHPLWIPKHLRQDFNPVQTAIDENPLTSPDARPSPGKAVLYWGGSDDGEAILVKTRQPGKLLNATGRLIWNLCDSTRTRQDILQELKAHFDDVGEDVLARDLDGFINDLVAQGFLQFSSNMSAPSTSRQAAET